jgi:peptide chain release factor subunit 1
MGVIVNPSSSDAVMARRPAGARRPVTNSPIERHLARLASLKPGPHRVVTCYLKIEPRDRARGKYAIKLKNRVRAVEDQLPRLGLDKKTMDEVKRDLGRVVEQFRTPETLPSAHGVAVFASEPMELFEVVPLPAVYRSRLAVDSSPLVRELASVEDEIGHILAVVLDRSSARFFEVGAFEARELTSITSPASARGRYHASGRDSNWGEHTYNNRIREQKQRHYELVARRLFELDRQRPAHAIVVGAVGTEATALEPFLHAYLVERVIGTVKLNPRNASPPQVHEAVLGVREEYERATERQLVDDVANSLGGGWAVNGVAETLAAMARGQVRSLLVNADSALPGFRAADTGRLALTEKELQGEGAALPVIDVIDDALEDALRQSVELNVVFEPEARGRVDGLAGLLRFR